MSIDRLKYFAVVVETRSLRQAAEYVGISPPSMSKAISVLEDELGCKLIYSKGRGIGITSRGLEVYRLATALLEENQNFYQRLKQSEHTTGLHLRIATFEVFSSYFLSSFFAIEPFNDVFLLELPPGQIEEAIKNGTVDLGLTYLPAPDPEIEYTEIGSFEMGIYGHKKWQHVPFEKLPFAVPITELRIHSTEYDALDMWPSKSPRRYIKYRFELLETALQTSRKGLSVIHCPDFIVSLHNQELKSSHQLHPIPHPSRHKSAKPKKVYLASRKGAVPVKLERKLAKFMRSFKS